MIDWKELWRYRDLVFFMVKRDFTAIYKQSILGPLWYIIQPLAMTLVFTVVFGNVVGVSTDGTPPFLFYMSGMVLWSYFAVSMTTVAESLINNAQIYNKVYFPRLAIPVALVITNLGQFLLNMVTFLVFFFIFRAKGIVLEPNGFCWLLPLMAIPVGVIGLGLGLTLASMTVKYHDLRFALPFLSQMLLFLTPVVYPTSLLSENMRWIMTFNPMAHLIEFVRYAFLGSPAPSPVMVAGSLAVAVILLAVGLLSFNRVQRNFVDTI